MKTKNNLTMGEKSILQKHVRLIYHLSLFIGLIFFIGCMARYNYKCDFSLNQPIQSNNLSYSDSLINITFIINTDNAQIGFELYNKSDKMIKINWDDISVVSPRGNANRIMHMGVRFIERDAPQAPTTVPPSSKLNDALTPVVCVYYNEIFKSWGTYPLFKDYTKDDLENKDMNVYMPLILGETRKDYNFQFHINKVENAQGGNNGCLSP